MVRPPRSVALRGIVELLWATTADSPPAAEEWTLPTGRIHMAFRPVGGPVAIDRRDTFSSWLVGGPRVGPHLRNTPRGARSIGVMLAPGVSDLVFGAPARVLSGAHVALSELWGSAAAELADRVHGCSASEALDRVEHALVDRVAGRPPSARHGRLVSGLEAGRPLPDVARVLGLGERQARSLCWDVLGLSPRDVRRVARLQRVFDDWKRAPDRGWAERALRTGYADQAHLTREFKELTGFTPGAWRPLAGQPRHVPAETFKPGAAEPGMLPARCS